ncbi:hypothetical protein BpHYR1_011683 [Brachionus plicatilis]|uniref:Uncharacterized protein n=1 Tax=Brachionus plicatilis TaxID=10195 RepID=A0A3M7PV40_BRAPC|nr:hypothetical protein BpHYR1_011683 [Brachionus plicatilis]
MSKYGQICVKFGTKLKNNLVDLLYLFNFWLALKKAGGFKVKSLKFIPLWNSDLLQLSLVTKLIEYLAIHLLGLSLHQTTTCSILRHFEWPTVSDANSSQVDWSTGANSFGIMTFSQQSVNTTYWKLKASSRRPCFALGSYFSSFASS